MHIEPGVVNGAKILLSYGTVVVALALSTKMALEALRKGESFLMLGARSLFATLLVFGFFQILPHYPVGVSEVHFILGATLFLFLGASAASIGLASGLLLQSLFFAPSDLPQYAMNVTTLLVPLWMVDQLARRIIAPNTAYVDISYRQVLALSTAYQGGVVAWVSFWAIYGQGFGAENMINITSFATAYMVVLVIEPLADMALLAGAKATKSIASMPLFQERLLRT